MDNVDAICLDHIIMRNRNRAVLSLYRDMQAESLSFQAMRHPLQPDTYKTNLGKFSKHGQSFHLRQSLRLTKINWTTSIPGTFT